MDSSSVDVIAASAAPTFRSDSYTDQMPTWNVNANTTHASDGAISHSASGRVRRTSGTDASSVMPSSHNATSARNGASHTNNSGTQRPASTISTIEARSTDLRG